MTVGELLIIYFISFDWAGAQETAHFCILAILIMVETIFKRYKRFAA
jgi:hypothetical protein